MNHRSGVGVRPPSTERLRRIARQFDMDLTENEFEELHAVATTLLEAYSPLTEDSPEERTSYGSRDPGRRPSEEADPYNAFIRSCLVPGAEEGPLAGYRVTVKDNIAVAGVEMTCGTTVMQGYIPSTDAAVVRRLLDSGAKLVGKTNQDPFGISSTGSTSEFGPVLNPFDADYLAGGSSGGSAVSVASGDADVGIGTNGGGSVRIPAAWCGCVGFKPTHGIVPAEGVIPLTVTLDHLGPITRTVEDCIHVMNEIGGPDRADPQQRPFRSLSYENMRPEGTLTVGVLEEGFDHDVGNAAVDEVVREAIEAWEESDIRVVEVSIPEHRNFRPAFLGIMVEEVAALVRQDGHRFDGSAFDVQFPEVFGRILDSRGEELPKMLLVEILLGSYLGDRFHGRFRAVARRRRREVIAAYESALEEVDVLAFPTTPRLPPKADEDRSLSDLVRFDGTAIVNTSPLNLTGHPAISVPVGPLRDSPSVYSWSVGGSMTQPFSRPQKITS